MSSNLEADIDQALSHEERAVVALEAIAVALTLWSKLQQQRFDKEYPVKQPREATVTHVKNEEDELLESLGSTGESLEDWTTLGPREQAVIVKKDD